MSTPYDELLELIQPALAEMVSEGFAQTWRVSATKADCVTFTSAFRPGVSITWDGSDYHRWMVATDDGEKSGRGATLALAASAARTVGILL